MGLSILTFIISIFVYIGDFFYSLWHNMSSSFVATITSAFNTIFSAYSGDLSSWGVYAPLLLVITIAVGALLSVFVISAGKLIEDVE